jgi:hypothetical protein
MKDLVRGGGKLLITADMAAARGNEKGKPGASPEVDPAFTKVIAAFAADRRVTLGGKFGTSSLMRDGKVFAMFMQDHKGARFVAKLSAAEVNRVVNAGDGEHLVMGKRKMNEWLAMAGGQRQWLSLAKAAYRFVAGPGGK